MFIGIGKSLPQIADLPGPSRPGYPSGGGGDTTSFIMEIDTSISGSTPNNQFRLYSGGNTGVPYTINWGDGSSDVDISTNDITHTYPSPGVYEISITSPYNRIAMGSVNDKKKITKIKQWGNLQWTTMSNSFNRASNLEITATDEGDFSNVTSWSTAFHSANLNNLGNYSNWVTNNCTNIGIIFINNNLSGAYDFTNWDVSNVTNMSYFIASNANITSIDTTGWDVSKVTSFFNFASGCANLDTIIGHENWQLNTTSNVNLSNFLFPSTTLTSFDPSSWDVSKVTNFSQAFRSALNTVGSVDLSNWNINTSSNVNMYIMFGFNAQLTSVGDISGWDVSRVTNLGYFATNCLLLQLPNLSSWDVSNVTNLTNAFAGINTNASVSGIENWDTSSVNNATSCFFNCKAIDTTAINWDLRNCSNLYQFLRGADFQNSNFTLNIQTDSTLINASQLFYAAAFDDITIGNNVDFSNVTNFSYAFANMGNISLTLPANFSFASGTNFIQFLTGTTLSSSDYNTLLTYIEASNQNNNIVFDAPTCVATGAGLTARSALINDHGWTINDNS